MASHIKQALDDVYYGLKNPKRALDDAATRSAAVLGWWFPNGINAIYGHFKFLYYLFGVMICISLFIQRRI